VFIGVLPAAVTPVLDHASSAWATGTSSPPSIAALAPVGWVSLGGAALLAATLLGGTWLGWLTRGPRAVPGVTWDCGYAAPSARMQYTASSFGELLVGVLSWSLRPQVSKARSIGPFPRPERFHSHVPDAVLDRVVLPATRRVGGFLSWFRWMQRGTVQLYFLYVLAALVVAMVFGR
jgi:hydrogenase-4 component B